MSPVPREELIRNIVGKDALFCTLADKIDAELLDHAGPNLKVVATMSVGWVLALTLESRLDLKCYDVTLRYEHIDVPECKKRGIRVGFTPDCLTDATAELTIGLYEYQNVSLQNLDF